MSQFFEKKITPPEHLRTTESYFKAEFDKSLNSFGETERGDARRVFNCLLKFCRFYDGDDLSRHSSALYGQFQEVGGEEVYLTAGYSNLIRNIASSLPASAITYGCEVASITWADNVGSKNVTVTCSDGKELHADHVIVTCSLGVLKTQHASLFRPPLPPAKAAAIESMGFGTVNKIILVYERPFWPGTGAIKFAWGEEEEEVAEGGDGVASQWYRKIHGFDEPPTARGVLSAPIAGPEARLVETLNPTEVGRTCTLLFRKFLNNPSIPLPTRVIITK